KFVVKKGSDNKKVILTSSSGSDIAAQITPEEVTLVSSGIPKDLEAILSMPIPLFEVENISTPEAISKLVLLTNGKLFGGPARLKARETNIRLRVENSSVRDILSLIAKQAKISGWHLGEVKDEQGNVVACL